MEEEEVEAEEEQHPQLQLPQLHLMGACGAYNPQSLMELAPTQTTSGHSLGGTKWSTAPMTP